MITFKNAEDVNNALIVNDHRLFDENIKVWASSAEKRCSKNDKMSADHTILDLNNDCLIELFRLLPVSDLCSVSDTCSRFRAIAQTAFALNHKR